MTSPTDWHAYGSAELNRPADLSQASAGPASPNAGASLGNRMSRYFWDVLALISAALLVSATGVGIAFALFVLLFVKT